MRRMALFNTQYRVLLVITIGWLAASAPAAQSARTDPLSHTGLPSITHEVNASTSPEIDVTVSSPSPPTEQELAGDSLYQFMCTTRRCIM